MVKSTSRRIKSISKQPAGKAAPRKPAAPAKAPPKKPSAKAPAKSKWVFGFGNGKAEGRADMRNLLGGKGAGLAEMANLGLPVPPGFTITTAVCSHYYENGKTYPKNLEDQVAAALAEVGRITGHTFGDRTNPLLVSVRSGARASMPGMMDTVLNLGLNDETAEALAEKSGDKRFAYDSYRRFITMYSDVVLGVGHHHLPPPAQHPGELGHRGQRAGHGVRQYGGDVGHRRRLHAQSLDRRKAALRRVPDQRPGRGRGRRHPHPAGDQRAGAPGSRLRQ